MPLQQKVLGVIPARLASTRLPRKMLREIAGKPLLAWVYEAAAKSRALNHLVVATDAEEIAGLCRANGWPVHMTSPELRSGTDRVHAVARKIAADIYVNIQGDEPLLHPEQLDTLVGMFHRVSVEVGTLATPAKPEEINNPNAVKVVLDAAGRALYFSRAGIPFDRDGAGEVERLKHLGFYAFRRAALERFSTLPPSRLEATERLEQLRMLEAGIPIHVAVTPHDSIGVDTEADLAAVEHILLARQSA